MNTARFTPNGPSRAKPNSTVKIQNLNDLAVALAAREGGKRNQNIGELKEFIRCLGELLRALPLPEALRLVGRIIGKR